MIGVQTREIVAEIGLFCYYPYVRRKDVRVLVKAIYFAFTPILTGREGIAVASGRAGDRW